MRLTRDWCDLALVAEAAVSCLPREQVGAVQVRCSDALPPVFADHDRLEQVLLNLLSNAIRHNPPGTHVTLTAMPVSPNAVEIRVSDDGLGLPGELVNAPFEATRGSRSGSAGAGLGLSITRGIVEAHGGTIQLVGADPGAVFAIRLPTEPSDAERVLPQPPLAAGDAAAPASTDTVLAAATIRDDH
jgi:signal transduction histidine kinase